MSTPSSTPRGTTPQTTERRRVAAAELKRHKLGWFIGADNIRYAECVLDEWFSRLALRKGGENEYYEHVAGEILKKVDQLTPEKTSEKPAYDDQAWLEGRE